MSLNDWAKNEIDIACNKERGNKDPNEWDYGVACYESAYKAFQSLLEDEHSGMSIGFTKTILNRLIDGKPLTPIEDIPDIWNDITCHKDYISYQCKRMHSLFKDVYNDGTIKYFFAKGFLGPQPITKIYSDDIAPDMLVWLCEDTIECKVKDMYVRYEEKTDYKNFVSSEKYTVFGTDSQKSIMLVRKLYARERLRRLKLK